MLYSIQVPKKGGDTLFANQYAAYDELPEPLKKKIDPLVALHHYGNRDDLDKQSRTVASVLTAEQENKVTWVKHRVARPHPVTGRTALYSVSGSSFGIEGMPQDEAVALLDELKRHATQEKYQLRLKYGVGDVVIWDNASLLHSATLTDPQDPRTLWRITVKEEGRPHETSCLCIAIGIFFSVNSNAQSTDAARRLAVQRRPRLHQGAGDASRSW